MTIPKKSSRPITVNGRLYRWMVKPTVDKTRVGLTVQDTVTSELQQGELTSWSGEHAETPVVTPGDVKGFIMRRFVQPPVEVP